MSKNAFITLTFPRGKERKAGETSTGNPRNHRCASRRRITVYHAWRVAREKNKKEEGNYWLYALAVIALSSKSTEKTWLDQFWAMLAGAEPYGYADLKARLVRAHVEYDTQD